MTENKAHPFRLLVKQKNHSYLKDLEEFGVFKSTVHKGLTMCWQIDMFMHRSEFYYIAQGQAETPLDELKELFEFLQGYSDWFYLKYGDVSGVYIPPQIFERHGTLNPADFIAFGVEARMILEGHYE